MRSLRLWLFLPLTALLGGCPVWLDDQQSADSLLECQAHADCAPDEVCDVGFCVVAPGCVDDSGCLASARCDGGACVPRPTCATADECAAGEICMPGGFCAPPSPCESHADCAEGTWCQESLCVVPPEGACRGDSDCAAGATCVQDFCRDSAGLCQFDFECGLASNLTPRSCVDNGCSSVCETDDDCASSGTRCASGYCVPDRSECLADVDCGADSVCFLGRCLTSCAEGGSCALAEDECSPDGLCRPSWAPRPLCAGPEDCQAGSDCVDGVCRAPCPEAPLTCLNVDVQLTHCNQDTGYCEASVERTPECFGAVDCPTDESCVNALCRAL